MAATFMLYPNYGRGTVPWGQGRALAKDTVFVAREYERACRYVIDEWAYLTRTEGLKWRFSTDPCLMGNCKATVKRCCLGSAHFTCLWSKLADHRVHRPGIPVHRSSKRVKLGLWCCGN